MATGRIKLSPNEPKPKSVAQARLDTCTGFTHVRVLEDGARIETAIPACPFYKAASAQCSACGCFMRVKVLLPGARCPKGKW